MNELRLELRAHLFIWKTTVIMSRMYVHTHFTVDLIREFLMEEKKYHWGIITLLLLWIVAVAVLNSMFIHKSSCK